MEKEAIQSNKIALVLAATSIVLSVIASIFMSFWGASYAAENLEGGEVISERVGAFHPILIVYVLLPIIGLMGILKEKRSFLTASAIGMFLLTLLAFFSIGLLFLPASILLIAAAAVYWRRMR